MAMSTAALRRWCAVHKWTSILSTGFLLLLCLTGLPLIFHQEIDELTRTPAPPVDAAENAPLQSIVTAAMEARPGTVPLYLSWDDPADPLVYAVVAPSTRSPDDAMGILPFDSRTGTALDAPPVNEGVMAFLLDLHVSLLLGLPGTLFLGIVALLFVAAIVSGVVVYAPFMRRLVFGAIRRDRAPRVKWLDAHNFFGIVTTAWLVVVSLTGFVLAMETPITMLWQADQLADLTATYAGRETPTELVPVDRARDVALAAAPGDTVGFIAWPGTPFSSSFHYLVAMRGETPLTERLVRIALVDARTGDLTAFRETPWYVTGAFLSAPLHFGDYGGLPMKVLWALLDLAAIVVLGTGLYLWLRRGAPLERRLATLRDQAGPAA